MRIPCRRSARRRDGHVAGKRKQLIESYCTDQGIPLTDVSKARDKIENEHWYRDHDGYIIIPRHQLSGCMVQTLKTHPLKKELQPSQVRSFIQLSDLAIEPKKKKCDAVFERYIKHADDYDTVNVYGYANVNYRGLNTLGNN